MNITEKFFKELINNNDIKNSQEKEKTMINIENIFINKFTFYNTKFENIEYLTLRYTQLKDISFVLNLPNLWYMDVRNNFVIFFKLILD